MKQTCLIGCALLSILLINPVTTWAGSCPEGQKWNDRRGECRPIPGWKAEKVQKSVRVNAEDYKSISAKDITNIIFPSSDFLTSRATSLKTFGLIDMFISLVICFHLF